MLGRKGAVLSWYISLNASEVMLSLSPSAIVAGLLFWELEVKPPLLPGLRVVRLVVDIRVVMSGKNKLSGGAAAEIIKRHLHS